MCEVGGVVQGSLEQPPIVAKATRRRAVVPLATGLPLLLIGAAVCTHSQAARTSGLIYFLLGFVLVTGGILALVVPAELVIGPEGVQLKGALRTRRYGWDQTANFRLIKLRRTQMIGFDRPGSQTIMRDVASALRAVSVSGACDAMFPGRWDAPLETVLAALNEGRARWGGIAAARAPLPRPRHATGQRIDRRVYWIAAGLLLAIGVVLALLTHGARFVSGGLMVMWVWVIARRLHDIGRSGWWQAGAYATEAVLVFGLMGFGHAGALAATAAAGLLHLLFLAGVGLIPGTPGENRYGPPPGQLEPEVQAQVFG